MQRFAFPAEIVVQARLLQKRKIVLSSGLFIAGCHAYRQYLNTFQLFVFCITINLVY